MTTNEDIVHAIGKLEASVSGCREDIAELKAQEARIRSLEGSRDRGKGILVTIGVLAGATGLERLAYYLTSTGS